MRRGLLLLFVCLFFSGIAQAQKKRAAADADFARHPLWIAMLDDTSANFFTVDRAFNTYFAHHPMPETEHDVIGEHRDAQDRPTRRQRRRLQEEEAMRMDVKRYHFWRQQTLPYVQDDGRILTPSERLAIWRAQQK